MGIRSDKKIDISWQNKGKTGLVTGFALVLKYPNANVAEVLTNIMERHEPRVITQNGKAKSGPQDIALFEETQEMPALLKLLALGNQDVAAGRIKSATNVIARLRAKRPQTP